MLLDLPYVQMLSNSSLYYLNLGCTSRLLYVNLRQCYYFALNKAEWSFIFMFYFNLNIQHVLILKCLYWSTFS